MALALFPALGAALACGRGSEPPAGPPATPTAEARDGLLSDVGARPELVAVAVNSARRALLRNAELVTHLVNGLPPTTRFLILTNDRAALEVERDDRPGRVDLVELPAEHPITIWTQDPFLVVREGGETALLTSREFERADDRVMAAAIADAAGFSTRVSELFFEGGNVVSDERSVFVGANTIRYNAVRLDLPEAEVVLRFERELGRHVLVVGPFPQPIGHLDMMLTPLGEGRLALADPGAGARIAQQELEASPESVEAFEAWCEDHFFGHPSIGEVPAAEGIPHRPPVVRGETASIVEQSRALAPVLDRIAEALRSRGYAVERVPWLGPATGPSPNGAGEGEARKDVARYPMLTYNNVLLETGSTGANVYLPSYGWPALDQAAEDAWRAAGFAPHAIEGLTISAMYGGALRCSVKVLER